MTTSIESKKIRTFFAIEINAEVREAAQRIIDQFRQLPGSDKIKWVKADKIHLTLRFLGEIEQKKIAQCLENVAQKTQTLAPLLLEFGAVV